MLMLYACAVCMYAARLIFNHYIQAFPKLPRYIEHLIMFFVVVFTFSLF